MLYAQLGTTGGAWIRRRHTQFLTINVIYLGVFNINHIIIIIIIILWNNYYCAAGAVTL